LYSLHKLVLQEARPSQSDTVTATAVSWGLKSCQVLHGTRDSAIAERPRDALCHLISCQLLLNCMKNPVGERSSWSLKVIIWATLWET